MHRRTLPRRPRGRAARSGRGRRARHTSRSATRRRPRPVRRGGRARAPRPPAGPDALGGGSAHGQAGNARGSVRPSTGWNAASTSTTAPSRWTRARFEALDAEEATGSSSRASSVVWRGRSVPAPSRRRATCRRTAGRAGRQLGEAARWRAALVVVRTRRAHRRMALVCEAMRSRRSGHKSGARRELGCPNAIGAGETVPESRAAMAEHIRAP